MIWKTPVGYAQLSADQVLSLSQFYTTQMAKIRGSIVGGYRVIGKTQMLNVIEQTKQKLLDTLTALNSEFPDLVDHYSGSYKDVTKVQNIITNNIYGNNNPLNVGAGHDVVQKEVSFSLSRDDKEFLENLGVEKEDITELEVIKTQNISKTKERKEAIMSWLGKVTASLASKGLIEGIPRISQFVGNLI